VPNNFVSLKIFYGKVTPNDNEGLLEIESMGWPDRFFYSNAGDIHRLRGDVLKDTNLMAFGSELSILLKKYFGEVPPMMGGI